MSERRLLVVGSDDALVRRLQVLLDSGATRWRVAGTRSAEQALMLLHEAPIDVVLCELSTPKPSAWDFLAKVKQSFPAAGRVVLAHASQKDQVFRVINLAHQVLPTPATDASLRDALERGCALQALFSNASVNRLVGKLDQLPSVPSTYVELVAAAARPDSNMADLAAIVERDPAMTVKVLQLGNSAFFGTTQRMASIQQAMGFLGVETLKGLILDAQVFSAFEKQPVSGFSIELFQKYSLSVARLAKKLLRDPKQSQEAFTAGLLHDLGKMVLAVQHPELFAKTHEKMAQTGEPLYLVENTMLGVTHAEVGASVLASWGLPFAVVEAVAYHHTPSRLVARGDCAVLAAVHAADTLLGILTCADPPELLDRAFLQSAGVEAQELKRWEALAAEEAQVPR
jgi:putative nucleotidyltransferase with HDIG domain